MFHLPPSFRLAQRGFHLAPDFPGDEGGSKTGQNQKNGVGGNGFFGYCHSARDPEKPTLDIQTISLELRKAKELIQSVMEGLRAERGDRDLPLQ